MEAKETAQQLTLKLVVHDDDCIGQVYACDFTVTTAGDGHWQCEAGRVVRVTGITVMYEVWEDTYTTQVNVTHDSTWNVYTDSAFEHAISSALGFAVQFTEQGMQQDKYASMELA